jgi:hypothetical protein
MTDQSMTNPLAKHFRQPAIYLSLPSKGEFWPEDALSLPANGEIPIYPMTAHDEIMFKTPDALINGTSVAEVIQSCVPNIKSAWKTPGIDVDAILIAIRMASYGAEMEVSPTCPHCKEKNDFIVDLRVMLDTIKAAPYSAPFMIDGLMFKFSPRDYKALNEANTINFQEQQLLTIVNNESLSDDERKAAFEEGFKKLTDLNTTVIVDSISSIQMEDGTVVSNPAFIRDFLANCSRQVFAAIKDKINALASASKTPAITHTCEHCNTEFKTVVTFDQSNFFG